MVPGRPRYGEYRIRKRNMFSTREKKERMLGVPLFLKAGRCSSPKCALVRRQSPPGIHSKKRRRAFSEFAQQLREKQKIMFTYGLRERQLQRLFAAAGRQKGVASEGVIKLLERRLDNTVYRLGIAPSRAVARQLVNHGHILLNGKRITVSSALVRPGDTIAIRPRSRTSLLFADFQERLKSMEPPLWLALDREQFSGRVVSLPQDLDLGFDVARVVDYYAQ